MIVINITNYLEVERSIQLNLTHSAVELYTFSLRIRAVHIKVSVSNSTLSTLGSV